MKLIGGALASIILTTTLAAVPTAHAREDELSALWSKTYTSTQTTSDCGDNGTANEDGFCVANDVRNGLEIGVKFQASRNVTIVGIRIYRTDPGPVRGSLWLGDGTLLMQDAFASKTTQGWQDMMFSQPLTIAPGQTYVVSYFTPGTRYAFQHGYHRQARTEGAITTPASSEESPNGVHCYEDAACGSFPTRPYRDSTYFVSPLWRDVVDGDPVIPPALPTSPTSPPPTSPEGDTTGPQVVGRQGLTIRFSEAVRPSTLNTRTVRLLHRGRTVRVTLRRSARRVVIVPKRSLAPGNYRVVVTTGVQDMAGNALRPARKWTMRR
jgi:hypothetical protein